MSKYRLPEDMCTSPCPQCDDWDHDDWKNDDRRHDDRKHDDRKPDDDKVVMKCGTGSGFVIPINNNNYVANGGGGNQYFPPMVAGIVSINTSKKGGSTVKIDFSSMINFQADSWNGNFEIELVFQLSKMCDGGAKIPLGTWIYEKEVEVGYGGSLGGQPSAQSSGGPNGACVEVDFKQPFSFTWCECTDCPGCCTYVVELVHFETHNIECASVTNVGINALAVGC